MPNEAGQQCLSSNDHEAAAEEAAAEEATADGPSHSRLHHNQDSDLDEPELFLLQPARRRTSCSSASSNSSSHGTDFGSRGFAESDRLVPATARHVNGTANTNRQRQTQSMAAAGASATVLQWLPKQGPAKQRLCKQAPQSQQGQEPQPQECSGAPQQQGAAITCRLCGQPDGFCSRPACRGYCTHCDKSGHTTADCRKRARLLQRLQKQQQEQSQQQQQQPDAHLTDRCQLCRQPVSVCIQSVCRGHCTHCDRPGHRKADCRKLARQQRQQQVQEQQQAAEVCKLCGQPVSSCRRPACWGYCTHCNKEGHRTANCRRRAAATAAAAAAVQQLQPLAVVPGSSSNPRPMSQPPAAAAATTPALKPELLLHKATAMHAVQQIIGNVVLQQQIKSAVQSAPRQQVVAAVCEQLHYVSADVEADVDNLSSQDLEELVTLAELVAAAQQLQQHQQGGKKKKQAVVNGRATAQGAAAAAAIKHDVQLNTAIGRLGSAEAAAAAATAVSGSNKTTGKPRVATAEASAAGQMPMILLQRPLQASTSAPIAAAAAPAAHQQLPPPPPPRKPAAAAAAPPAVLGVAVGNVPSALLSASSAPPAVTVHPQHQQQLVGLQRPHPVYARAASNPLPATVPAAGTPTALAAAAAGPHPLQLPATVPVTLSGPLQSWMLWCKAGATRAVQECIQQDHIVQEHLINVAANAAEWQLVTVLDAEVGFLIKLFGAGQLQLQDVEGLRRLGQSLGQAKQMGPQSHMIDGALTAIGCYPGPGTAAAAVQGGVPSARSAATTAAAGRLPAPSYPDVCYKALLAWLDKSDAAT